MAVEVSCEVFERLRFDWSRIKDERGAIAVLVAVSLVGIIGFAGLAIDLGRGYLDQVRISRAVDAAVIAGASAFRSGQAIAQQHAEAVAALNGVVDGENGVSFSLVFGTNAEGENTVSGFASHSIPTTFMRILGQDELQISALAVAAVPPVDLALVIDQSYSLAQNNAWDDLQAAAAEFVAKFSDDLDMVGLSSFHARAVDRIPVDMPFQVAITSAIGDMRSAGYTNTGEGLLTAFQQMQNAPLRQRSTKVVVFFTDGRPTAIRGIFGGVDRVIVVSGNLRATRVSGYYNYSTLVTDPSPPVQSPFGSSPACPNSVGRCWGLTGNQVRSQARQNGIDEANQIRSAGYILYTIGLGNPGGGSAPPPDLDYLRLLANEDGVADPDQPRGRMFFAPTPAELSEVFDLVAKDLLVRLAV